MGNRFDPRIIRPAGRAADSAPEVPFQIPRTSEAQSRSAQLDAAIAVDIGAPPVRPADNDRATVLGRLARDIKLPTVPEIVLQERLDGPGTTIQMGLDFPGRVDVFNADHVFRSETGKDSWVRLQRQSPGDYSGYVACWAPLPSNSVGIYLAVVHVGGDVNNLKIEGGIQPTGGFYATSKRSGTKFLVPFEVDAPGSWLCFGMTFPPDITGTLLIYNVELTKVS